MKRAATYFVALVCCLVAAGGVWGKPKAKEITDKQVTISGKRVVRDGQKVNVSMKIEVGNRVVTDGNTFILRPMLTDGFYRQTMSIVVVRGPKAARNIKRHKWAGEEDRVPEDATTIRSKGAWEDYRAAVDFQPWMSGSDLMVEAISIGGVGHRKFKDNLVMENVLAEAKEEAVLQEFKEELVPESEQEPEPEPESAQEEVSTADRFAETTSFVLPYSEFERRTPKQLFEGDRGPGQIYFRQDGHTIEQVVGMNRSALEETMRTIRQINTSPDSRVKAIMVAGFSSIEGSAAYNERLALKRAVELKKQIITRTGLPQDMVMVYNGGEDWDGLRQLVVETNGVPSKEAVLRIIDNVPIWDKETRTGRESELMKLDDGAPYRWMNSHLFPQLRSASYVKIFYENW